MLNQGLNVMLTGMGTVFGFLVVLWFSISIMGSFVCKLNEIFPEPAVAAKIPVKKSTDDEAIAAAIAMSALRM